MILFFRHYDMILFFLNWSHMVLITGNVSFIHHWYPTAVTIRYFSLMIITRRLLTMFVIISSGKFFLNSDMKQVTLVSKNKLIHSCMCNNLIVSFDLFLFGWGYSIIYQHLIGTMSCLFYLSFIFDHSIICTTSKYIDQ